MPSERLQTAFFYTNFTVPHPSRYTVILKPAIPAQAGIRICRDSLKSGGGGMVLQINDVDTNSGEFAIYTAQDASVKLDLLKMELKHCKEMLEQKTKKSSCSAS